tara:strand:+ start:383 stop:679 length:297 start_codon:yes stop_codon:yes gene_type:complete
MTWSNIKEQLNKNLKQKGIEEQVHESLVISLANSLMVEIWGIEIQQKARVVYFKNDILTIAVLANNIEVEFEFHKDNFIKHLNKQLGNNIVKNLRFLS